MVKSQESKKEDTSLLTVQKIKRGGKICPLFFVIQNGIRNDHFICVIKFDLFESQNTSVARPTASICNGELIKFNSK